MLWAFKPMADICHKAPDQVGRLTSVGRRSLTVCCLPDAAVVPSRGRERQSEGDRGGSLWEMLQDVICPKVRSVTATRACRCGLRQVGCLDPAGLPAARGQPLQRTSMSDGRAVGWRKRTSTKMNATMMAGRMAINVSSSVTRSVGIPCTHATRPSRETAI